MTGSAHVRYLHRCGARSYLHTDDFSYHAASSGCLSDPGIRRVLATSRAFFPRDVTSGGFVFVFPSGRSGVDCALGDRGEQKARRTSHRPLAPRNGRRWGVIPFLLLFSTVRAIVRFPPGFVFCSAKISHPLSGSFLLPSGLGASKAGLLPGEETFYRRSAFRREPHNYNCT